MKKRFASKGIEKPDLSAFREILKAQHVLEYKEMVDDIMVTYPITTIAIKK